MPEDWEKYAVKSKQAETEIDDWEQFAVKKKADTPAVKSGLPPLNSGSSPFQDTKPVAPTVLSQDKQQEFTEKNKGYVAPRTPIVPKAKSKAEGGAGASFMAGLNSMNEGIFKIPRYLYDLAAVPQNIAADLLNVPELAANYDDVVKSSGYASPLSTIDRLGDHYKGTANMYEERVRKYDKGIVDSFLDGKYGDAGAQIVNNISGSVPSMILMATTAGAGNAAQLGYAAKTMANALPFASQKNAQVQDDESIPQHIKTINATLNGLSEVIFDQSFGTQAAISKVVDLFQKEGRDVAVQAAKDLTKGYVVTAIKKVQPLTSLTKGAVEEMTTQLSQNIVDKYTVNPEKDLMEGVLDAGVVGGAMTGTIEIGGTSIANLKNVYTLKQKQEVGELMKQRTDLVDDLDNESLTEDIKDGLSTKLTKLDEQISAISDAGDAKIAELPEEKQKEVLKKQEKVEAIEQSLQAENISDTSKAILTEQLEKNQAKIDEILDAPVEKVAENTSVITAEVAEEAEVSAKDENDTNVAVIPENEPDIIDVTNENPESLKAVNDVFKTAEFDLMLLKKTENKVKKHEASIKKLVEAKKAKLITDTEFDDMKARFDDVLADSDGKAPKPTPVQEDEVFTEREQEEVNKQEPAQEVNDIPTFTTEDQAIRYFVENETDPEKLASQYHTETSDPDYTESGIMDYLGTSKINARDYQRFGDNNNLDGALKTRWIDGKNSQKGLDVMAMELSDQLGVEVTPEDFIYTVTQYRSRKDFDKKSKSKTQRLLQEKYYELTGKVLTDKVAEKAFNKVSLTPKTDQELFEINTGLQNIGISYEDIERYEEYSAGGFGSVEESVQQPENESDGSTEEVSQDTSVQEPEPDVKPKEEILSEAELARKLELRKKFARFNDITNIIATLADKEFREYAGLILKEAKGEFKAWSKEMVETMGDTIKEHLPKLFDELTKPKQETATEPESDDRQKRATVQKILNGSYSPEFKAAIADDTIFYKELSYKITDAEATAIIELVGKEQAARDILDLSNGMSSPTRNDIAQKVMNAYEQAGDYDSAIEVLEKLAERITDMAQGLQSLSNFPRLGKISQVRQAQKEVTQQRDKFKKQHKKTTDKVTKQFKKANEEAAQETVEKLAPKIRKADEIVTKEFAFKPEYGASNKVVRRDGYLKAKKQLRGKFFTGVPVELITIAAFHLEANSRDFVKFSRTMILDIGTKVKPYLKELYTKAKQDLLTNTDYVETDFLSDSEVDVEVAKMNGEAWKEKLERAIIRGRKKDAAVALARLQAIAKEEGLWGKYKAQAVAKLKATLPASIEEDRLNNPAIREFTDGLVRNMQAKMKEILPESASKQPVQRKAIDVISDAYKNFEKYEQVWADAQTAFVEKYSIDGLTEAEANKKLRNLGLSREQAEEVVDNLDDFFGEILDSPFSKKFISLSVKEGLDSMDISGGSAPLTDAKPVSVKNDKTDLSKLVLEHYTVLDNTKRKLVDKLVEEAGLTGKEANELAEAIENEFDRIATAKKKQILERIFSTKERKKAATKTMEGEIIKMTNLGAFREDDLVSLYGDKMGWPKLTEANIKEIERLADRVQNATEGPNKRRAVEDLLAYQATIKGTSIVEIGTAIWYANMLSGPMTQVVNFSANAVNVALLYGNAIAQNPKSGLFVARGLFDGLKRGLLEGAETLNTGYSPIKGKAEVPNLLERYQFTGLAKPLNYAKYVRRLMVGADVVFFEGLKNMRAYQLAYKQAAAEGKLEPTLNQRNRAIEIVGESDGQLARIQEQAELEMEKAIAEINASAMTAKEKKKAIDTAEVDKNRRVFDLIEAERGELIEETAHFAAEGTYNYPPKGFLGAFAASINYLVGFVPAFRFIVPFTNIIANVANETINYTPLGLTRLKKGGYTNFRREPISDQERADLMTKAIMGTTLTVTMLALSQAGDDEEPYLEITANGSGDYAKNEALKLTGWQQFSFRFKLPNGEYSAWISYQYTPLLPSLALIGNFNDLKKYKAEKDYETLITRMTKAIGMTTTSFFQATYLDGLNSFLSNILDPRRSESLVDKGLKALTGTAKALAIPNAYTYVAKGVQKYADAPAKEVRGTMIGSILQDIPYARNMYYDKINILGDEVMHDDDKFFSSNDTDTSDKQEVQNDKIIQLIVDKKAMWGPMSPKTETIYDIVTKKQRALSEEEFYEYSKAKGKFIKDILSKNYEVYAKLDDALFKKKLTKIKTKATKKAKYQVMNLKLDEED